MATYRMGEAAELLGVSVDTLRRWVDAGRLRAQRTSHGQRVIDGAALATFARSASGDDAHGRNNVSSARNRFRGLVTQITRDRVMAQVELQAGPHRIVALISREAVDELGLAPGSLAIATVKATNVVIEQPVER